MVLNLFLKLCPVQYFFVTFNPTLSIYLLQDSFHLVFCLRLRLFPGPGASDILLSTCPSSLLLTCLYHFSSVYARIERGQGADLGKGHFCARPIILRALLRVILHFEGTMGK